MEMPGFEPGASYMRSKRSTAELHPQVGVNLRRLHPLESSTLNSVLPYSNFIRCERVKKPIFCKLQAVGHATTYRPGCSLLYYVISELRLEYNEQKHGDAGD